MSLSSKLTTRLSPLASSSQMRVVNQCAAPCSCEVRSTRVQACECSWFDTGSAFGAATLQKLRIAKPCRRQRASTLLYKTPTFVPASFRPLGPF